MVTAVSPEQPQKARPPIEVTESGMTTDDKPLQPQNAAFPIEVTELPIVTTVRPEQPQKAPSPIEETESGIVTSVSPLQFSKARGLTDTTPSFITAEVLQSISSLYLYTTFPIQTIPSGLLLYHGVFANASSPIKVTEAGIETAVKPSQPVKTPQPI